MEKYISYKPTSGRGPIRKTDSPEEGFEIIRDWTYKFTIGRYSEFELQLTIPRENYPDLDFLDKNYKRKPLSGTWEEYDLVEWIFLQIELPDLFNLMNSKPEFFKQYEYSIKFLVDFVFLDQNENVLKGQNLYDNDKQSWFLAFIYEDSVSIEPTFMFPFEADDDDFKSFYKYLENNFPFELSDKNLYLNTENPRSKSGVTKLKLRK